MDSLDAFQRAIDFVEDNILEDLKTEVIAAQAYMSDFLFQRVFTVVCQITLGDYIRNRRLTLAAAEVAETDHKIIDIAYKYGYETPESFSRAFSKFHGMPPVAVRRSKQIPKTLEKISVKTIIGGREMMKGLTQRGYTVQENGPVYYTKDMDKTGKWFEDILGWYVNIDARDENGNGTYGCALPIPGELVNMHIAAFNGIHLFYGDPSTRTVAFMPVDHLDKLVSYVKNNGWTKISDVTEQPWGAKECDIETIDGSIMRFFELA